MNGSNRRVRRSLQFFGQVQGVGFRWRARHAANLYGCTGWCRNDFDGSVAMEIQGTPEAIDQVIEALERGRYIQIDRVEARSLPIVESERAFVTL